MAIDKTTGKGCAWSIASKPVTEKLIAEGIIGKPIYRKQIKSAYRLLCVKEYNDGQVYAMWQKGSKLAEEPLWTPSFIEAEIWERGVSRFPTYGKLDRNVEEYLLPEMEEYLQNIPDAELLSMTKDFLIEHGVINAPIAQRAGDTYYFNVNEVYTLDKKSELFPYEIRVKYNLFNVEYNACINMNVWHKAVSQFEVGMTLENCISIFLNTELVHGVPKKLSPIDRLIQHIYPPVYERVPGNQDETTFDHIRMTVGLPRYQFDSWEALQNEVKKYQREIYKRVVQKLEKDRYFRRYGVPINFLKLSSVILLRDFSMEFIFELRELIDPPSDMGN